MKQKIILLALGILTNFCLFANPTNLTITLNGYDSNSHKNFVDIIIPDINYPFSQQIKISEQGIIQTSLLIEVTREIIFSYDQRNVSIIVSPNDNIEIEFKIQNLFDSNNKIDAKTSGLNKETNALIYDFGYLIDKWILTSTGAFYADKTLGELKYQSLRAKERESQIKKLDDLIHSKKISNQLFIDWAESKINYAAGTDFCTYPFLGGINKTITEKDSYFKFINKYNPKNIFVSHSASYTEYLKTLSMTLNIIGAVSNSYEQERNNLKKDSLSIFPVLFKIISQTLSGKQRESGLTKTFLHSKNIPEAYFDSLSNYLTIDEIEKIKKIDEVNNKTILKLLEEFDLREKEKAPLKELYESTKGKIVLHDFWFIGCAPCMSELPHYNTLIEKSGDDVEFIFFGVYMEEEKWKEKIESLNLKGKHYLLSKNQIAFFERYFKLKGFPHHQIINKSGQIKDGYFPSVIPNNFDLILDTFNKIRAEN